MTHSAAATASADETGPAPRRRQSANAAAAIASTTTVLAITTTGKPPRRKSSAAPTSNSQDASRSGKSGAVKEKRLCEGSAWRARISRPAASRKNRSDSVTGASASDAAKRRSAPSGTIS